MGAACWKRTRVAAEVSGVKTEKQVESRKRRAKNDRKGENEERFMEFIIAG